jgi:hypothetical protein
MISGLVALPAIRSGIPARQVFESLGRDREFWTGHVLSYTIVYSLMVAVFPKVHPLLVKNRAKGRLSWERNRWFMTICGAAFIFGTAIPVIANIVRGTRTYGMDQLGFTVVIWVLYGWMIVRMWANHPSAEEKEGFETGDRRRSMDERYQLVLGKSAVSTLYWTLGIIFVGGSLYDILATHKWPARSVAEFAIILLIWNAKLQRTNRET